MNISYYNTISEQFTDFSVPDINKEYLYAYNGFFFETASRITYLMKLVLMINNPNALDMIKNLLKSDKTSLNSKNSNGFDALMIAVNNYNFHKNLELIHVLIDAGANVNTRNNCYLRTVELLLHSEFRIDSQLLRMLIDNGAYINDFLYMSSIPLLTSMFINYNYDNVFDVADILISGGANIDIDNPHHTNILSYMFYPSNITKISYDDLFLNKIKYIISKGVDINGGYKRSFSPLILLCNRTLNELSHRIEIENKYNPSTSVSTKLCKKDIIKFVKFLIDNGADVNISDDHVSALTLACSNNEYELANLLIDNGAQVNNINQDGSTVLTKSVSTITNIEIVKLLIDNGAEINFVDNMCKTALMNASLVNNLPVVEYLISVGADVNIHVDPDYTTVGSACKGNAIETLRYLLNNTNVELNFLTTHGKTPLSLLCQSHYFKPTDFDVLETLILKCDAGLKDSDGYTAYDYFYKNNRTNRNVNLSKELLQMFRCDY